MLTASIRCRNPSSCPPSRSASPARWRSARRTRPASSCTKTASRTWAVRSPAPPSPRTTLRSWRTTRPRWSTSTRPRSRSTRPSSTCPPTSPAAAPPPLGTPLQRRQRRRRGHSQRRPGAGGRLPVGDLRFGASVSAPFGLKTEYDADWVGRYNAIKSDVKTVDFTFSAALRSTTRFSLRRRPDLPARRRDAVQGDRLRFGALCRLALVRQLLNPAFPFRPQKQRRHRRGQRRRQRLSAGSLGMHIRPIDNFAIGFSHRSEIDHTLTGDADFTVPANVARCSPLARRVTFVDNDGGRAADHAGRRYAQRAATISTRSSADGGRRSAPAGVRCEEVAIYPRQSARQPNPAVEDFAWKDTTFTSASAASGS